MAGVQKLQKRLNLLEMDITVHREQISVLSDQAKQFVSAGHFDAAAIQERQEMMEARYQGLQVCVCVCVCVCACVHACVRVCVYNTR